MNACPFGVPHFDWDKGIVEGAFIDKCTMCPQRIDQGEDPACVATCPTDALEFGNRDELLAKAHARIKAHPDRYVNHVYGETENGGTSYLIISHMPFKELGLPDLGPTPLNEISETVMEGTLPFAVGWAGVLSAVAVGIRALNKNSEDAGKETAEETIEPESVL
jgi:hypothetical protein